METKNERKPRRGGKYAASGRKPRGQRQRRRLTRKELLLLAIPVLAVIAAAAITLLAVNHGSSYEFTLPGRQYYCGGNSPVAVGSRMQMDTEGNMTLIRDGQAAPVSLPIYLDGRSELVLSQDMVYYAPRSRFRKRALHFSHIAASNTGLSLTREGKTTRTERGFLYDGEDFYLFLENVVVEFNGYSLELPPLSYVEAIYGGDIMVFNSETKECFMDAAQDSCVAHTPAMDYEVALLADSMTTHDGRKELLVSRPDLMDPIA